MNLEHINKQIIFEKNTIKNKKLHISDFSETIKKIIKDENIEDICDIGGGANPFLENDFIKNLNYSLLDISKEELDKAPINFNKIHQDAASKNFKFEKKFDLVFSKFFLEHIKNPNILHLNMHKALKDKGYAIHLFPTLFNIPFIINMILPEKISQIIVNIIRGNPLKNRSGKFPAYYKWCFGPTKKQIKRLEEIGYDLIEYKSYYGHPEYYKRLFPFNFLHDFFTKIIFKFKIPLLTSYAIIIMRKK